ncbi:uncharacterized protein LOC142226002 [Haematobia irritans]|uniref:uncharacterized protein LOC142226002 n=1 Tax=Haematobia irritans TaxID=7368 RepID=UPI003F507134
MHTSQYNLRQRGNIDYKEDSGSGDDLDFYDSSNTEMSEMENILKRMEELQSEVLSLREARQPSSDVQRPGIHRVHIPKFNKHNPELWFAQIERSFALYDVTQEADKFDIVSVHLEDDILLSVEDLITNPPAENKYTVLKQRIVSRFAESPESKLRRLLQGGETAGLKPSEVLSHMKHSIRPLLTVWEEEDLDKLAKMADKMLDANMANASVTPSSRFDMHSSAIKILNDKFDTLQIQQHGKNKNRHRSRSRSSPRVNKDSSDNSLCWYHQKFGDAAQHCKPNCTRYNNTSGN